METLLTLTLSGSALALLLLALRYVFLRRMPSTVYYYAWLLVLLRFALPLPGLVPTAKTAAPATVSVMEAPLPPETGTEADAEPPAFPLVPADDIIPIFIHILIHFTRLVVADVDAHLAHDKHCFGVDTRLSFDTTRIDCQVLTIRLKQAVSHLTSASIACTKHQHLNTMFLCIHCARTHHEGETHQ